MTVGKGILKGQVPYRDLFEHKGPIIYFIHALAALLSDTSFIGVFVIQYFCLVVYMIYTKKTTSLFVTDRKADLIVLISTAITLTTWCYIRGDNAEEYVLPMIAASIFYTLEHYKNGHLYPQKKYIYFLNGIFTGIVLWLKFNLLGYWIGWVFFLFIPMLVKRKFKRFIIATLLVLCGIVVVTLPILIYFRANEALYELFYTYFYCNIFLYSKDMSISTRIFTLLIGIVKNFALNPTFMIVTTIGFVKLLSKNSYINNKISRLYLIISFLTMYLGVYSGGVWYDYYALIIASYTIFGVITVYMFIDNKIRASNKLLKFRKRYLNYAHTCMTAFVLVLALFFSNCFPYIGKSKEHYPQFKFAEIISKKQNPSLLNYGFIDGGFYLAADIQPRFKYFHKVNIPIEALPEMYEQQYKIIKEQAVDFVVVRIARNADIESIGCSELNKKYNVVTFAYDIHDNYKFVLFEKSKD